MKTWKQENMEKWSEEVYRKGELCIPLAMAISIRKSSTTPWHLSHRSEAWETF